MPLPIFFTDSIATLHESLELNEDTSKHVVQVLRMRNGELLQLTDGKGNLMTAQISEAHKKRTLVKITRAECMPAAARHTAIAISLLKNANRFEWFLEKATELGIRTIIPLICEHTERQHFRQDRMQAVLVSAMLQSQQSWLPELYEPVAFEKWIKTDRVFDDSFQKFIAHCADDGNKRNFREQIDHARNGIILIGPEGDFSADEIALALQHGFMPVSLGDTRLRAETAGMVAATILQV
jgi:16S rRNA (uracil1498-N3)-methyltransferase